MLLYLTVLCKLKDVNSDTSKKTKTRQTKQTKKTTTNTFVIISISQTLIVKI